MTVGKPIDDRRADPGHGTEARADPAAAQHQPPVLETILGALKHAGLHRIHVLRRDRRLGDRQIAQFGQGEEPERQRQERQPVPEVEGIHRPAQRAGLRVGPDHRQHDAEARRRQAAQRRVAGQDRNHGDAEDGERQKLRRADIKDDRPQQRDRKTEQRGAEQAAHQRRHIGGAERPPGFAALGHRQPVEHGCGRSCPARHAEHDGRYGVPGGRDRGKAEQESEGGIGIHAEGERHQKRDARDAADAGQDAENEAQHDTDAEEHQPVRFQDEQQRLAGRVEHATFHQPALSALRPGATVGKRQADAHTRSRSHRSAMSVMKSPPDARFPAGHFAPTSDVASLWNAVPHQGTAKL
jgi:hypothetical protein